MVYKVMNLMEIQLIDVAMETFLFGGIKGLNIFNPQEVYKVIIIQK